MSKRRPLRHERSAAAWPRVLLLGVLLWLAAVVIRSQMPSVIVYKLDRYLGSVGIFGLLVVLVGVMIWIGHCSANRRGTAFLDDPREDIEPAI